MKYCGVPKELMLRYCRERRLVLLLAGNEQAVRLYDDNIEWLQKQPEGTTFTVEEGVPDDQQDADGDPEAGGGSLSVTEPH
jgi:hypothetical protein